MAGLSTVQGLRPNLSRETGRRLEDTVNLAVRAVCARAPSATTTTAERAGATRHADSPAWVAEQRMVVAAEAERMVAVAGIDNRSFVMFLVV